jgi:stage II sporulation protein D
MKMFKKTLSLISASLIVALLPMVSAHGEDLPAQFEFRGSGYGHGVGMSQFGAYGQALEGGTATDIVTYYYPGTTVESVDDSQLVRVNIADKVATVGFSVEAISGVAAPIQIYSGDLTPEIPSVDQPLAQVAPGGEIIFSVLSGTMIASLVNPDTKESTTLPTGQSWTLRWSGTPSYPGEINVVKMRQGSVVRKYKYGQVQVKFIPPVSPAIQGSIIATTTLRIHSEYLRGIGEVPSSWPSAALEAQVIAARSFAIVKASTYRKSCDCNLYSSVQDQNFVGYSKESEPIYGQKWVDAITATEPEPGKGLAVTYKGKVISTFYASSTGGTTQDVAEVWGTPIPYLVPVPDPWSLDPLLNPTFSSWTRRVKQADFAKAFGLPDVIRYEITSRTKAGGVKTIMAFSASGKNAELTGEVFRSRLKLPSTWISRSVNRVVADSSDALAIAVARNMWPGAKSAVLVNFEKDQASALVGMSYGNSLQLPVFNVTSKGLSKQTVTELARRKISSVVLIGKSLALPSKAVIARQRLKEIRFDGRTEVAVSEKTLTKLTGDPIILIDSEKNQMVADAPRIVASGRPVVWSRDYQPSENLAATLSVRGTSGIFYGELRDFRFPTRIVITRSNLAGYIAALWQSPVLIADGTEVEKSAAILSSFPNIAAITVMDSELDLTPYQNLS